MHFLESTISPAKEGCVHESLSLCPMSSSLTGWHPEGALLSFASKLGCTPLVHQAGLTLQWCVGLELSLGHKACLYWAENDHSTLIIQKVLIILRRHETNIISFYYVHPSRLKPAFFLLLSKSYFFRLSIFRTYFLPFFVWCISCFLTIWVLSLWKCCGLSVTFQKCEVKETIWLNWRRLDWTILCFVLPILFFFF